MIEYSNSWLDVLKHLLDSAGKDLEAAQFVHGFTQLETNATRAPYLHMALEKVHRVAGSLEEQLGAKE